MKPPSFFVSVWILVGGLIFEVMLWILGSLSVFLITNGHTSELIEYLLQAMNYLFDLQLLFLHWFLLSFVADF